VVLAKTGAGKSYGIKGDVVEPLLEAEQRVCIVDPTDAWHGLRSSATGKSGGYPVVIFGGEHGDLPLAANHGEAVAEIVGTSSTSCIIVTKHLSVRDRTRFFTDFADGIMRKNKGPLHLIIDEAHRFAPKGQKMSPQSGEMLAAANELVSAGRSAGLRCILITQRPAKLHNDSLSQCETLVALRMISPADRNAVMDWVKENATADMAKEILQSLAELKTGEAWVWSPQLKYLKRVRFPKIRTYDSGKAPESGAEGHGLALAPINRDAIAERLKSIGADVVANDPTALRRRVAELERQVAARPKEEAPSATELKDAHTDGYEQGYKAATYAAISLQAEHADGARQAADEIHTIKETLANAGLRLKGFAEMIRREQPATRKPPIREIKARGVTTPPHAPVTTNGAESPSVRKILDAIHAAYPVSMSFDAAARRAAISSRSSAYRQYRKAIASSAELERYDDRYRSRPEFAKSGAGLSNGASVQQWAAKLPPTYGKMLLAIHSEGALTKDEVAAHAGVSPTSSGLGSGLRELKRLALIVEDGGSYSVAEGL
jgi:hypothetical protein